MKYICYTLFKGVKALKRNESKEDYLEAILVLKEQNKEVGQIDIAKYLDFSKPSVSLAMKNLSEGDLIEIKTNGSIDFKEKGYEIAKEVYERHTILRSFLIKLGVSFKNADTDACQIEYVISNESFEKIKKLYKSLE